MMNGVFWDAMPCDSCKNRRSLLQLLVAANVISSSLILSTLMMGRHVHPKYRFLKEPHGVTFHKTAFLTSTVVDIALYVYCSFEDCFLTPESNNRPRDLFSKNEASECE
jgi:hypothetical protein